MIQVWEVCCSLSPWRDPELELNMFSLYPCWFPWGSPWRLPESLAKIIWASWRSKQLLDSPWLSLTLHLSGDSPCQVWMGMWVSAQWPAVCGRSHGGSEARARTTGYQIQHLDHWSCNCWLKMTEWMKALIFPSKLITKYVLVYTPRIHSSLWSIFIQYPRVLLPFGHVLKEPMDQECTFIKRGRCDS